MLKKNLLKLILNNCPFTCNVSTLCRNSVKYSFSRNTSTENGKSAKEAFYQSVSGNIYDVLKNPQTDLLLMPKFFAEMEKFGILYDDPRIKQMVAHVENFKKENRDLYYKGVNLETFIKMTEMCSELISQVFLQKLVITDFPKFHSEIEEIFKKCKENRSGKVADYIPQLAKMPEDHWAVSVCTVDGQRFNFGESDYQFTVQSCSKPITYAIALDYLGTQAVHSYVGKEPSGRMFNELILNYENKPHNPMINPGAIVVCSLLQTLIEDFGSKPSEVFESTKAIFKRASGDYPLGFNTSVYISEQEAANRNYAIAFYLKEHKCFPSKSHMLECMKFYFRCCSIEFNTKLLSILAATLANGGTCPLTNDPIFKPSSVKNVLSLMYSCGMYDYSGEFAFEIGVPAKSGVSGAMMVVIPNVMGISLWSPRLERMGNSERGVQFCQELVKKFSFHKYETKHKDFHKIDPSVKCDYVGQETFNIISAAAQGNINSLRKQYILGVDLSLRDYDKRSALHLAATEGHADCVEFLLKHADVDPNSEDRWGNTPITEATKHNHEKVVEMLNTFKPENKVKRRPTDPVKSKLTPVDEPKDYEEENAKNVVESLENSKKEDT